MSKKIKKETIKVELNYQQIKPVNIASMALSNYSGGVHQKSNKAKRKNDKMKLKKELSSYKNESSFCFVIENKFILNFNSQTIYKIQKPTA